MRDRPSTSLGEAHGFGGPPGEHELYRSGEGPDRPPGPQPQLLECGHVGVFTGVCQFQGCATRLCDRCISNCVSCGRVVCPRHTIVLADTETYCPADVRRQLLRNLALRILTGGSDR